MQKRETLCRLRAPARLAPDLIPFKIPVKHWRRLATQSRLFFSYASS